MESKQPENATVEEYALYLSAKAVVRAYERKTGTAVAVKCPRCGHRHTAPGEKQEVRE